MEVQKNELFTLKTMKLVSVFCDPVICISCSFRGLGLFTVMLHVQYDPFIKANIIIFNNRLHYLILLPQMFSLPLYNTQMIKSTNTQVIKK